MAGNLFQKALYMGVGLANYAAEKAGKTLKELRTDAEKLANEMVQRGEITTEEARKMVEELVQKAQDKSVEPSPGPSKSEPRLIEIVAEEEEEAEKEQENLDTLRQEVESLQDELRRLKRN